MEILEAYQLASRLHTGQLDKAGRPYIEHLSRVFLRVMHAGGDRDQQIAALLHDAIEDDRASESELLVAGVPPGAVLIVLILTRQVGQNYMLYLAGVKADPRAVLVKMADLDDNMDPDRLCELEKSVAERLSKKYQRAVEFMLA